MRINIGNGVKQRLIVSNEIMISRFSTLNQRINQFLRANGGEEEDEDEDD